jgi:hypothetical protein
MPTPVGPPPPDPNDPDLWDWGDDDDEVPTARAHPGWALLAAFIVVVLIVAVFVGYL